MTEQKKQKYPKYWRDQRSQSQKIVTQRLAEKLSQINLARKKKTICFTNLNHLFITIGGVPPNQNQFIGLKFPGKVINYRPPFFQTSLSPKISQQEIEKRLFNVSMDNTCQEINQIIENNGFKEVIFVYHSFGGSIVACFSSKYPEKIKGLICLGGTPVRFYPIIKDYTKAYLSIPNINRQFIIENYEVIYSLYDEKTKNHKSWTRFKSKEELLSFTLHNDPNTLNSLFDKVRSLPLPILMVYGNNDQVLTKALCAQAMIYMSYLHLNFVEKTPKLEEMSLRFKNMNYESLIDEKKGNFNLQEKFIYFVEGGHSIHISQRNNQKIQKLIDEYLYTILDQGNSYFEQQIQKSIQDNPRSKL